MLKKLVYSVAFIVFLCAVSPTHAASKPFSIMAFLDQHVCNDAQVGPNDNEQQIGVHVRDIAARRRVGLFSFDISELKAPGAFVKNVSLSNLGAGGGNIDVYGVIEEQDNLPSETELVWNNAPGVKNDPAPPVADPIELDLNDLTPLLMTFDCPDNQVRVSTATSQALADFINSDTDGIVTLLFAPPQDGASAILRAKESNDGGIPGGTYIEGEIAFSVELAVAPDPVNEAPDAYRDVVLSWTPGQLAGTHDVYFGTVLDDVSNATRADPLGALVSQDQQANAYAPGRLEFGQTYYWRIDEVNAPPTSTVFKGVVWSFTVEPFVYPVEQITASASSVEEGSGPENTINGSGLDGDDLHSIDGEAMWLSSFDGPQPAWIQYDLGRVYQLHEMWVWNYNGQFEDIIGYGIQNATVEYSADGTDWTALGDFELAQGTGLDGYGHDAPIDFGDAAARYVKITANSDWGGMGQPGLSEVRFLYIPTAASYPQPVDGQAGIALDGVLTWRPGREAASHDVYFDADEQAVIDGTALVGAALSDNSQAFGPLNLGETYYWKVDEVNEAQPVTLWAGDLWSFTTAQYFAIDGFESYTDDEGQLIYETWTDGYGIDNNGSQVGNELPPYAEQDIVHEGAQSMPLAFNNVAGTASSEAKRTFSAPQDWTQGGATTLRLYFYGDANNNVAEPMWVKLTDQSGASGTITYGSAGEDVNNLANASWHEWTMMLADFGIDSAKVKTVSIGFGSPGGASSGNSGRVYIDDVEVGIPAAVQ